MDIIQYRERLNSATEYIYTALKQDWRRRRRSSSTTLWISSCHEVQILRAAPFR